MSSYTDVADASRPKACSDCSRPFLSLQPKSVIRFRVGFVCRPKSDTNDRKCINKRSNDRFGFKARHLIFTPNRAAPSYPTRGVSQGVTRGVSQGITSEGKRHRREGKGGEGTVAHGALPHKTGIRPEAVETSGLMPAGICRVPVP